jgi:hypothetical protein
VPYQTLINMILHKFANKPNRWPVENRKIYGEKGIFETLRISPLLGELPAT